MSQKQENTEERIKNLTELQKANLEFIMKKLKKANAEYNRWDVLEYIPQMLELEKNALRKRSGEDLALMISQQLDKRYSP